MFEADDPGFHGLGIGNHRSHLYLLSASQDHNADELEIAKTDTVTWYSPSDGDGAASIG